MHCTYTLYHWTRNVVRMRLGEGFAGALHWEELVRLATSAGFCSPVLYETTTLQYHDDAIAKRLPADMKYKAATFRLFKRGESDGDVISTALQMSYSGGLKNDADEFRLTSSNVLKVGTFEIGNPG